MKTLCLIGGLIGLAIFGWGIFADFTTMVVIGALLSLLYVVAGFILHVHRQEEKIKKKEVAVEDMIRGIHYDVDPRSESLRTRR